MKIYKSITSKPDETTSTIPKTAKEKYQALINLFQERKESGVLSSEIMRLGFANGSHPVQLLRKKGYDIIRKEVAKKHETPAANTDIPSRKHLKEHPWIQLNGTNNVYILVGVEEPSVD